MLLSVYMFLNWRLVNIGDVYLIVLLMCRLLLLLLMLFGVVNMLLK